MVPLSGAPITHVDAQAAPKQPVAGTSAPTNPIATPPALTPPTGGGDGSGGGTSAPSGVGLLLLPDGRQLNVGDGDAVSLPLGVSGNVSLIEPDRVPSTIVVPSGQSPVTLHPRSDTVSASTNGVARLTGALTTAEAGLVVQYVSAGRTLFAGARTAADGTYGFNVPVAGTEQGLVIAHDANEFPRLAIARVNLSADATTTADPLALATPTASPTASYRVLGFVTPPPSTLPTPPAGMAITASALSVVEGQSGAQWRLQLLSFDGPGVPSYDISGFTFVDSYEATTPAGDATSLTSGPPGAVPDFLAPPDLSIVSRPTPGGALAWPAVSGATLYTVTLAPSDQPDAPVWEGACTSPDLTVPASLDFTGLDLTLQVSAWNAPDVTLYSVASLRELRVPSGPQGPSGCVSVASKTFPAS
ncbi:MAG TPA: hypothetical protein V6D47_20095 [Oscillatoriaceae cyanobacterium]